MSEQLVTIDAAEGPEKLGGRRHANVQAAKLAVMEDVAYIQKRIEVSVGGGGGKYKAAGAEDFISAIRPAMVEHGLTITPILVEQIHRDRYSSKSGADWDRVTLRVRYRISHAASGTFEEGEAFGEGACNSDKAVQKGMTSAFKYFVRQEFMLETGEDDPDRVRVEAVDKEKRKAYQEERFAAAKRHIRAMFDGRRPSNDETRRFLNGLIVCLEKDELTRRMVKDLRLDLERRYLAAEPPAISPPKEESPRLASQVAGREEPSPGEVKAFAEGMDEARQEAEAHAAAEAPIESHEAAQSSPEPNTQPAPAAKHEQEVEAFVEEQATGQAAAADVPAAAEDHSPAFVPEVLPRTPEPPSAAEGALRGRKNADFVSAATTFLETCTPHDAAETLELADWAVNDFRLEPHEFAAVQRMVEAVRNGRRPSAAAKSEPKAEPKKDAPPAKKSGPTTDAAIEAAFSEDLDAAASSLSIDRYQALFSRIRDFGVANPKRRPLAKKLMFNLGSDLQRVMNTGKMNLAGCSALVNAINGQIKFFS